MLLRVLEYFLEDLVKKKKVLVKAALAEKTLLPFFDITLIS